MPLPSETELLTDLQVLAAYEDLRADGSFSKALPLVAMLRQLSCIAVSPASYAPNHIDGENASLPVDKLTGALLTYGRRLISTYDTVAVESKTYSTAVVNTVPSAITETTILAANPTRHWAAIENSSASALVIKLGTGVSLTSYSFRIAPNSREQLTIPYSGIITGLWETANGAAYVSEISG